MFPSLNPLVSRRGKPKTGAYKIFQQSTPLLRHSYSPLTRRTFFYLPTCPIAFVILPSTVLSTYPLIPLFHLPPHFLKPTIPSIPSICSLTRLPLSPFLPFPAARLFFFTRPVCFPRYQREFSVNNDNRFPCRFQQATPVSGVILRVSCPGASAQLFPLGWEFRLARL